MEQNGIRNMQKYLLEGRASKKGTVVSVTLGVIGCMLLGVGMCCTMVWMQNWFIPGVVIGVLGIAAVAVVGLQPDYERKERESWPRRF